MYVIGGIQYCDAFLKAGPHAISEILLAYGVYYSCWMCALYFILKVLLYDVLRIGVNVERIVVTVIITLGVILPFWQAFGDYFVQVYAISVTLLTNGVYYVCWMCALYFILKFVLDNVLRVKVSLECLVVTVIITLGVLLSFWQVFGDYFVQACDYSVSLTDVIEYLLSLSPFYKKL